MFGRNKQPPEVVRHYVGMYKEDVFKKLEAYVKAHGKGSTLEQLAAKGDNSLKAEVAHNLYRFWILQYMPSSNPQDYKNMTVELYTVENGKENTVLRIPVK